MIKLSVKILMGIVSTLTPSTTPHPARLHEETWMIGGVLMRFLMLDLAETYSKASYGYYEYPDTQTPSPVPSRTLHSPRLLEDRWSLDEVSHVRS